MTAFIDGVAVQSGYGITIKSDDDRDIYNVDLSGSFAMPKPRVLFAWLTQKQWDGTYAPVRKLDHRSKIVFWDSEGRRVEFQDGEGTITETKKRL